MINVIITIHVLIVLALIGLVLIQRSDGSALGIGGGGSGGFMTGSGAANALTRTTSILAAGFFATSLGLAIFAQPADTQEQLIEDLTGERAPQPGEATSAEDLLRALGGSSREDGDAPVSGDAPASGDAVGSDEAPAIEMEGAPADAAPLADAQDQAPETTEADVSEAPKSPDDTPER
ncbi:MAG: preprotein translocase subunit SecG [Alphaproteobacteria bacterium]|nr:preprotein translocase subunit SecG [Alphaproteobacteria bacterium]